LPGRRLRLKVRFLSLPTLLQRGSEMDNEWLQNLKVGDAVIIKPVFGDSVIGLVSRLTKTQIAVGRDKYRKTNGFLVGGDAYYRHHIKEATKERLDAIAYESEYCRLRDELKALAKWRCFTNDQLGEILELVKSFEVSDGV